MSRHIDEEPTVIVERRNGGGTGVFLAGLAIGAGLALLLAPSSGVELRRNLRRTARRAQRTAGHFARDVRERATEAIADAREGLETRVDDARSMIRERREDVDNAVRTGRAAAKDARTAFERRLAQARASRAEPEADGD
jgi:gas vesicle protein